MAAFRLLTFAPPPDPMTAVPAAYVEDLRREDFGVAQMYHHAPAEMKVQILRQLQAHYLTPESYMYSCDARGFVPVTRWWTEIASPFLRRALAEKGEA